MTSPPGLRDRVRQLVKRSPGTQGAFGAAVGMDKVKLSKSLHGTRQFTPHELMGIAEFCEVSVAWLLFGGTDAVPAPVAEKTAADPSRAGREARERILQATWVLLARHGYQDVRIADVANLARVSPSLIHYHFLTRDELLNLAMQRNFTATYAAQQDELLAITRADERISRLIELQLPLEGPAMEDWRVWAHMWSQANIHPRYRDLHCELMEQWNRFIATTLSLGQSQRLFRPFDVDLRSAQLTAMINGLGLQVLTGAAAASADAMREQLQDFVTTAIRVSSPPPNNSA